VETFEFLGEALLVLRKIRGLTQKEAAKRARMGPGQLGRYEKNKVRLRVDQLDRILAAYGATLFDLATTLAAIRSPEIARAAADQADEIRDGAGRTLLLLEGGLLVPKESHEIVADLLVRLHQLVDSVRNVVVGRALREPE
jgi:transcriptional regulator with XRE-family HTH domain